MPDHRIDTAIVLADDLLEGAQQIARFIYGPAVDRRKAYRAIQSGRLPIFRIGNRLCARRSVLLSWIGAEETRSVRGR